MKLFEVEEMPAGDWMLYRLRIPGGWIYRWDDQLVFVPLMFELQESTDRNAKVGPDFKPLSGE
jgi:hypothetical protein